MQSTKKLYEKASNMKSNSESQFAFDNGELFIDIVGTMPMRTLIYISNVDHLANIGSEKEKRDQPEG